MMSRVYLGQVYPSFIFRYLLFSIVSAIRIGVNFNSSKVIEEIKMLKPMF